MDEPLVEHALLKQAAQQFRCSGEPIALSEWGNGHGHGAGAAMQAASGLADRGLVVIAREPTTSLAEAIVGVTDSGHRLAEAQRTARSRGADPQDT